MHLSIPTGLPRVGLRQLAIGAIALAAACHDPDISVEGPLVAEGDVSAREGASAENAGPENEAIDDEGNDSDEGNAFDADAGASAPDDVYARPRRRGR